MNTKIDYLYRDADNYKSHNECVIKGVLSEEQIDKILSCRNDGEWFIPSQVGLPEKKFDRVDLEVDHPWFELEDDAFSTTEKEPTVPITAEELVKAFESCKDKWDEFSWLIGVDIEETLDNHASVFASGDRMLMELLNQDKTSRYQLLSRMQSDCDYYLGNGNRSSKHLWALDEKEQISYMKKLWESFKDDEKPEWLTFEQILEYEGKMLSPAKESTVVNSSLDEKNEKVPLEEQIKMAGKSVSESLIKEDEREAEHQKMER